MKHVRKRHIGKGGNLPVSRTSNKGRHRRLAMDVLMGLRQVANSSKRHFQWLERKYGISGIQLWAMVELSEEPGMKVSELADAMAIHQSTASALTDKLVKAGRLRRVRGAEDRRAVHLSLTESGHKLLRAAPRPAFALVPQALSALPDRALSELRDLVSRLQGLIKLYEGSEVEA